MGWPTGPYACAEKGCAQRFSGGVISWSAMFGAHVILGSYMDEWERRGGLNGIGPAYNDLRHLSAAGGWQQNFGTGMLTQSAVGMVFEIVKAHVCHQVTTRHI